MTLQGFPAAITPEGISRLTRLPAPMTTSSPMVTPGKTETFDGEGVLQAFVPLYKINGMSRRIKAAVGTDKNIVAKNHRRFIENHAVIVRIKAFTDFNVVTVITIKGSRNFNFSFHRPE